MERGEVERERAESQRGWRRKRGSSGQRIRSKEEEAERNERGKTDRRTDGHNLFPIDYETTFVSQPSHDYLYT